MSTTLPPTPSHSTSSGQAFARGETGRIISATRPSGTHPFGTYLIILAIFWLAPVHAQDHAGPPDNCTTSLVRVDDKGILSTDAQCGLSARTAKSIEDALFQIRHDLKPSSDQMHILLAANNIILGTVLDRLIAGDMSLDGVMQISQLLANKSKAEPDANLVTVATQWKEHYENLMESLKTVNETETGDSDTSVKHALQSLDLDLASGLLDELIAAQSDKAIAKPYFLKAQIFLLQFQPINALPLLEKARQLQPDNHEYAFAYARVLQEQNAQGSSAEATYVALLEQYRELAKDKPTAYLTAIAATLNNLGMLYAESKRTGEAEKAFREALDISRSQAKDNMTPSRIALALVLNNLANFYLDGKRLDEAENAFREALEIQRVLAKQEPSVYLRSMAATLNNLGNIYSNSGNFGESEKSYREALSIQRELYHSEPEANAANLKTILTGEAAVLQKMGRMEDAAKILTELGSIK